MKDVIIAGAVNIAGSATDQSLPHIVSNVEFHIHQLCLMLGGCISLIVVSQM